VQKFDGFLKLYQEVKEVDDTEDKDKEDSDEDTILPEVTKNEIIELANVVNEQHYTQPPPRYSEASLVKKLEELGIGRPSTYASIISVLSTRNYVEVINKKFIPTDRGKLITAFLNQLFTQYVDYNFTAGLEESLDDITSGKIDWIEVLSKFWEEFNKNVSKVKELRTREILDMMNVSLGEIIFDKDNEGKIKRNCACGGELSLKIGRFGAFIGCSKYPECKFTRPLSRIKAAEQDYLAEPKEIGKTEDDKNIVLKKGRFGPYLQVGNEEKEMKNISIPKGISLDDINLEKARFLATLPKVLGIYPENNMDITLNNGRYGPYVKCDKKSATLETPEDIFTIGINKAVTMIAEAKPGRRSSNEIKTIGEHPEDKKPIKIMKGSYGPYVKYKTINATIPDDKDPESITMEEALDLIEKRLEYDASKKGKTLKKKPLKKEKKKSKIKTNQDV
jgi:DNA topoisomerase-1